MSFLLCLYGIIAILALAVFLYRRLTSKMPDMTGKHVVITGGSSGLGIALAQDAFDQGAAQVTLIARKMEQLEKAASALKTKEGQKVNIFTADVTDYESLSAAFEKIKELNAPIDYLFANAGYARPGEFDDLEGKEFKNLINVNGLGAINAVKLAKPLLSKGSHITFSGSICSLINFTGYSAYGPSKYALKGFADAIRNEFVNQDIHVHMGILSSMDSPGFKIENMTKPTACAEIEGTATLFKPEEISKYLFRGINNNDYFIYMEILTYFIIQVSYGICPSNNLFADLLCAPFVPLIRFGAKIYIDLLAKTPNKLKEKKD